MIVSVNYGKKLDYILNAQRDTFDHVYVATTEEDAETLEVIQKHNCEEVFFDFTFRAKFNFGGARRKMQGLAYKNFPGYAHLLLDADILLPKDWKREIEPDVLYGCTRKLYSSLENMQNDVGRIDRYSVYNLIGFFQLYLPTRLYFYENGETAAKVDENFARLFQKHVKLQFIAKSLGEESHWEGIIENDFQF